jgi:hypothetical protein
MTVQPFGRRPFVMVCLGVLLTGFPASAPKRSPEGSQGEIVEALLAALTEEDDRLIDEELAREAETPSS